MSKMWQKHGDLIIINNDNNNNNNNHDHKSLFKVLNKHQNLQGPLQMNIELSSKH